MESGRRRVVVFLPSYNEAASMGHLIGRLAVTFRSLADPASVLVVDDGSDDGTREIAEAEARGLEVRLDTLVHETNRGLGAALSTGFEWARDNLSDADVFIGMDADDTHDPEAIPAMLKKIDDGFDVVIASRYAEGGREVGLSTLRRILSRGASVVLGLFLPVPGARDYSCGYRAYRGSTIARAYDAFGSDLITERGFVASAEILIKCARLPARVGEVPLVLRYDRKGGASKMNIADTIMRYLRLIAAGRRAMSRRQPAADGGAPS